MIMSKKATMKATATILVTLFWGACLYGQELNDVITKYNEGAKAAQTDVGAAIDAFENAIQLADKVGSGC